MQWENWLDFIHATKPREYTINYPPKIQKDLKIIIKYEREGGKVIFNLFQFKNGEKNNRKLRKLPPNFVKGKVLW
jgi:hypothetical protein